MRTTPHGQAFRYVVRFTLKPGGETISYAVVTALGELKAAVVASTKLYDDFPEARIGAVAIEEKRANWEKDSDDLLDYWGLE